jgi:hypothetical protein
MISMKTAGVISLIFMMFSGLTVTQAQEQHDISTTLTQAFLSGNANVLSRFLPAEGQGRVQMAIADVGISSGNYSAKQTIALLQQAFRQYITLSFRTNTRISAVRSEWTVKHKSSEEQKTIVIYVSFQEKNGLYIITSIRGNQV